MASGPIQAHPKASKDELVLWKVQFYNVQKSFAEKASSRS